MAGNQPVTRECISANANPVFSAASAPYSGQVTELLSFGPLVEDVLIDIPHTDTGTMSPFSVRVTNGFRVFNAEYFGWSVTFFRIPVAQSNTLVVPQTIPTATLVDGSKGLFVATVILPETDGLTQYWVPVLKKHKAAVLHAREWTVIFQIVPIPAITF